MRFGQQMALHGSPHAVSRRNPNAHALLGHGSLMAAWARFATRAARIQKVPALPMAKDKGHAGNHIPQRACQICRRCSRALICHGIWGRQMMAMRTRFDWDLGAG